MGLSDFQSMRVTWTIVALLAALAGASAIAGPAAALEPGVFVDPHSPAGKEYSIPLDVQRGAAVGHPAPEGVAQPLFGVGISAAGAGGGRGGQSSNGAGTSSSQTPGAPGSKPPRSNGTAGASANGGGSSRARSAQNAALGRLSRPRATASQIALIGVPVVLGGLLLGATIALALRRRG